SIPEKESFHFDIPSFSRPPAKPPDGNTRILDVKMMGDISDQKVPMPTLMITLIPNQEKSFDLLSHRGLKTFQPSAKCPMMIHGKNIPILDVPLFHFYPPWSTQVWGNLVKLIDLKQALRGRHPMGELIQKLLLYQKCMGYLVRTYYNISSTRYYKDDSCWNADIKSKTTKDIISNRSFMEVLVLNHYVLVKNVL
nr:hypothetical protein [Tanacetum cinerariifolium]